MHSWLIYSTLALICYGIVGLLQKVTTNRVSADTALVWYSLGYLALLPWFLKDANFSGVAFGPIALGVLAGFTARLGEWCLFASMRAGAKASIAVPFTSTYPVVTLLLAMIFLHETLTLTQWAAITLAVISAALMSYETAGAA
jgi:transporter family protein